jgi:hypothetical protein
MKASGIWRVPLTLGAITGSKQRYSKTSTAPIRSRKLWPKIIEVADPACYRQKRTSAECIGMSVKGQKPPLRSSSFKCSGVSIYTSVCC